MTRTLVASLDHTKPDGVELPLIDVPFTTVVNRAQMSDLSKDLKPRMGIDRFQTQDLVKLVNESGPSGEAVFKSVNDKFNQVRFYGNISTGTFASGSNVGLNSQDDIMEVTFYGTGLNLLVVPESARSLVAEVDLGGEGSDFFPSIDSIIRVRNYAANVILPIPNAQGLTLDLHTVKIRNSVGGGLAVLGFEILNESTQIVVPEGSYHKDGITRVSDTEVNLDFDTGYETEEGADTGDGGRVCIFIKQDGTIAHNIKWNDAGQLDLAAADHSNEEVIGEYYHREFGASRADDFSAKLFSGAGGDDASFTLDDGTTTLIGEDMIHLFEGVGPGTTNDFMTLTFVGTGLDLFVSNDNGSPSGGQWTAAIDGGSANTINHSAVSGAETVIPIVSGLSYGTHTCKITNPGSFQFSILQFIVYGPKKPELPEGALELGEYFLMADFVANSTAGLETIATGTIRKSCIREFIYAGGTFAISASDPDTFIGGTRIQTTLNTESIAYTFFGTGFEFRWKADAARATLTVDIDGETDFVTGSFGALATSVYGIGGGNWTPATGTLDQSDGSDVEGSGLSINGLTLGLHTVTFTKTGGSAMSVEALDIITPIHSPKFNGPFMKQNTLRVGSQGINDLRTFDFPEKKQQSVWNAIAVLSHTTTMSPKGVAQTIRTTGNPIRITYSGTHLWGAVGLVNHQIYVDGKLIGPTEFYKHANDGSVNNDSSTIAFEVIVPVEAGDHHVHLQSRVNTGAAQYENGKSSFIIEEMKD